MFSRSKIYKKQLLYFLLLIIIIIAIFGIYRFKESQLLKRYYNLALIQQGENLIKDLEFYQNYSFMVPYIFSSTSILPSTEKDPILIGHIRGDGIAKSIVFHTDYYGIAIGYSVDDNPIIWINNGHCLKNWGADSPNAILLPVFLLYYNSQDDLSITVNTPIGFKKSLKIYFINSDSKVHNIDSLHLYLYGKNIQVGQGNFLKGI